MEDILKDPSWLFVAFALFFGVFGFLGWKAYRRWKDGTGWWKK